MPRTGRYDTPREGAPHILRIELSEDLHWPYETDGETEIEDAGWTVGTAKFVKFVGGITDPVLNPSPTALGRVPVAIPDVTFEVFDIQKRQGLSGERFYAIYQWDSERFEIIASPTNAAYSARDTVGLSTSAAFQTLPLNTEVNNELGIWTLAANEVTINDTGFFHFTYGFRLYTTGTHITTFHVEEADVKIVRSEISGLTLATPSNGPTYTNSFIHEITASGQAFRMRGVGSAAGTGFVDLIHLEIHKLT